MKKPMAFGKTLLAIGLVGLLAVLVSGPNLWGPDAAQAATVGPTSQQQDVEADTALLATNSIHIKKDASVTGGVIVNVPGTGPIAGSNDDLQLEKDGTITGNAAAETINIKKATQITGDVTSDDCPKCGPPLLDYVPPIIADLPAFKPTSGGSIPLNVPSGTLQIPNNIDTGVTYGDVTVGDGATLILLRDIEVTSISMGLNSKLLFAAPTDLLVAGRFDADANSEIRPCEAADNCEDANGDPIPPASLPTAAQVKIYVNGVNVDPDNPIAEPLAAQLGENSTTNANYYVPNGTFKLEQESELTGSVIARDISIEKDNIVIAENGFADQGPIAFPQTIATDGKTPFDIVFTGADPEGQPLIFRVLAPLPGKGELKDANGDTVVPGDALVGVVAVLQCNDGLDNDGDGLIDHNGGPPENPLLKDPDCDNASDDSEGEDVRDTGAGPTASALVTFIPDTADWPDPPLEFPAQTADSISFTVEDPGANTGAAAITIFSSADPHVISGTPVSRNVIATTVKNANLRVNLTAALNNDPENVQALTYTIESLENGIAPQPDGVQPFAFFGTLEDPAFPGDSLSPDDSLDDSGSEVLFKPATDKVGTVQFTYSAAPTSGGSSSLPATAFLEILEFLRTQLQTDLNMPLEVTLGLADPGTPPAELSLGPVALVGPAGWTDSSGLMDRHRNGHESVAVTLGDGRGAVLAIGGDRLGGTVDVYDQDNDAFLGTIAMLSEHGSGLTATRLQDGRVLVAGGTGPAGAAGQESVAEAEIWRSSVTVTDCTNANPIVVTTAADHGFSNGEEVTVTNVLGNTACNVMETTLEVQTANTFSLPGNLGNGVYDSGGTAFIPLGSFTPTDDLTDGRDGHTATLLPPTIANANGTVLIASGRQVTFEDVGASDSRLDKCNAFLTGVLGKAEIFDPAGNGGVGEFNAVVETSDAYFERVATLVTTDPLTDPPTQNVLLTGSAIPGGQTSAGAELTEATVTDCTNADPILVTAAGHGFDDGDQVTITGVTGNTACNVTEQTISNVTTDTFVLFSGGNGAFLSNGLAFTVNCTALIFPPAFGPGTAELYDPVALDFSPAAEPHADLDHTRQTATLLSDGGVLVAGGVGFLSSAEIYDPENDTWTCVKGETVGECDASLGDPRQNHTATLLTDDTVLLTGGEGSINDSSESYDPADDSFSEEASMGTARTRHAATLLEDGSLLVTGGVGISTSVDWTSGTAGLLDGGAVTFALSDSADITSSISSQNLSGADYSAAPLTAGTEVLSYNHAAEVDVTFESPVSNLLLYGKGWRGFFGTASAGSGDPVVYTFDKPFTIVSGFGNATASGLGGTNVLSIPDTSGVFEDGILQFAGPVGTLNFTTNASCAGQCSNQSVTFGIGQVGRSAEIFNLGDPDAPDAEPEFMIVAPLPASGTLFDMSMLITAGDLPYTVTDPQGKVTYVPAVVGDFTINYTVDGVPGQIIITVNAIGGAAPQCIVDGRLTGCSPIECDDSVDNDGDGFIDFDGGSLGPGFEDPSCDDANDDSE